MSRQDIVEHRKNKFLNIGREKDLSNDLLSSDKLFSSGANNFFSVKNKIEKKKFYIYILALISFLLFLVLFKE